jgi:hypothetical protein
VGAIVTADDNGRVRRIERTLEPGRVIVAVVLRPEGAPKNAGALPHPTPRWECTRITCPYLPARVGLFALFRRLITEQTVQTPQYGGQNDPITPYHRW